LSGNGAAFGGGGIRNNNPGKVKLNNTIVANSTGGGDLSGTFTGSRNLVRDGSGIGLIGTIVADPRLGVLADNGGPTWTFALLAASPAINAGDNSLISILILTDQRGNGHPRVVGGIVDIGAYESGS